MGTVLSRAEEPLGDSSQVLPPSAEEEKAAIDDEAEAEARKREHEEDMRRFKEELATKRVARKEVLAGLNRKIAELKEELEKEKAVRRRLEEELLGGRGAKGLGAEGPEEAEGVGRRIEDLKEDLEKERMERKRLELELLEQGGEKGSRAEVEGLERQIKALKDVAAIGGEMLKIRELQVNELKEKIKAIEETGIAYEKEVENMKKLKNLYEERSRAVAISHQMEVEREKTRVVAAETRLEIAQEKNRELMEANSELKERIEALEVTVDKNNNEISELRIQLAGKKEELYNVTSQMSIINNLFSQVLSDPESLDRVTRVLEEHHNLVNHLTGEGNINDVASVLMKVADKDHIMTEEEQGIASNLSKVWRLLVELLGHHIKQNTGSEPMPESCYKSIDTPSGPKLVISVSQTFLRLKDLILEKNSLMKEVGRLKDLNCHLEKRLISQESRLVEVAEELHKTWDVVNKLKSQHKALHTHEQVLRYELKHKRLMLNELKQQLEDCREMWQTARIKNNQTEKDWKLLRKEFAERKQQASSAESGYEESPGDSQDEDDSHKISDDESDIQDIHLTDNRHMLRISHLGDSSQSTPNRSNTPDTSMTDCSVSEINADELPLTSDDIQASTTEDPPDLQVQVTAIKNSNSENRTIPSPEDDRLSSNTSELDINITEVLPILDNVQTPTIQELPDLKLCYSENDNSEGSADLLPNDDKLTSYCSTSEINFDEVLLPLDNEHTLTTVNATDLPCQATQNENTTVFKLEDDRLSLETEQNEATPAQIGFHRSPLLSPLSSIPEDLTIELDSSVQILPWNDTSETQTLVDFENPSSHLAEEVNAIAENISPLVGEDSNTAPCSAVTVSCAVKTEDESIPLPQNDAPSRVTSDTAKRPTAEEILARRDARLKRLEEQCKNLFSKMNQTNKRSDLITSKLVELHEHYGDSKGEASGAHDPTGAESCAPESLASSSIENLAEPSEVESLQLPTRSCSGPTSPSQIEETSQQDESPPLPPNV